MQNKLYTIQLFSPPDYHFAVILQAAIAEPQHHKFSKFLKKFELPDKRGFELTEMRKSRQVPWPLAKPHS